MMTAVRANSSSGKRSFGARPFDCKRQLALLDLAHRRSVLEDAARAFW